MDVRAYNRDAWNHQAALGNEWTRPVSSEIIQAARKGRWQVYLTPVKPVPENWFPASMQEKKILCLASGGGQQGPIFAAAGAKVTVLDNSPAQLERDLLVAKRDGLSINIVEGDMRDLSGFDDDTFNLVFHPVSNLFIPEIQPVWEGVFRVLRKGGTLLAGFANPVIYLFDREQEEDKPLVVKYSIPYSDLASLPGSELAKILEEEEPLEFGHTLESQIGGQIRAGLTITGFYEDTYSIMPLSRYIAPFIATRGYKA